MQTDFIIVGQGLCGTWLSHLLQQAGQSVLVIDKNQPNTASKIASGIINPVTGRRVVKTWMIDELMSFATDAYRLFGNTHGVQCITQKPVIDCFATPQMRLAFTERYEKDRQFLSLPADEKDWLPWLQYDFGYGIIQPAYLIDMRILLSSQRGHLQQQGQLLQEEFDASQLVLHKDAIEYKGVHARKIIFCDGAAGLQNPFFPHLPYGLNKGEMVLVDIPGFPDTHIIKKGYSLVPWQNNTFWLGSTYLWEFEDDQPTRGFYQFADNWLKQTIKLPYTIIAHHAAVRPATLERKPFVGLHPNHPTLGILNGMGTKGCSLAPFFAKQLVDQLMGAGTVSADADVQRFKKVLGR